MAGSEPVLTSVLTSVLGNVFRTRTVRNVRTDTKHELTLEDVQPPEPGSASSGSGIQFCE